MKFFLDTANINEIRDAAELGLISGVTTNPSLVAKEGGDFKAMLREIVQIVDGPISAEVISLDAKGMVEEGLELAKIHENIVIKLPMTLEGLKACHQFATRGIKTNITLIFTANQALMAARSGATFCSPFLGRLDDISTDGMGLVEDIVQIFDMHDIQTEIIAASIRHPIHVTQAALAGAHIGTMPYKVLTSLVKHPLTDAGIERFLADWGKMNK